MAMVVFMSCQNVGILLYLLIRTQHEYKWIKINKFKHYSFTNRVT